MKKYKLYSIIIVPAPAETETCRCMSCQSSHGRRVINLRSAFLETADQTSQSDYRLIVIGSRSIGAPLLYYDDLNDLLGLVTKNTVSINMYLGSSLGH